jgi:hypothetical protein
MTLSLKNDVPSKSKKKKIGTEKKYSFVDVWEVTDGKSRGSGYKSADPDLHQHVKDQEHWYKLSATVIVTREKIQFRRRIRPARIFLSIRSKSHLIVKTLHYTSNNFAE